ncbi:NAD(P)-binding domain-containing protein [Propioniciclava coleopterorum]|uniref:NAD(P)-binding domain-containing protein n=1 Tax=Propioniciclava coleopterorum TaxID=2714937 RepID=UPI0032B7A806
MTMQMGLIGLGKMGGNMRERLRRAGHDIVGLDKNPDLTDVPDTAGLVAALSESPGWCG